MTMDTRATDAEAEDQQLPPESEDGQQSSGQEEASPPSQQPTRERELERRLTAQGRELAATKRTADTLASRLTELSASISKLTETQTAQAKADAERREREMEAYLASLPADERLAKRVEILTGEIQTLKAGARTDAQPSRAADPVQQRTADPDVEYMRQRVMGIVERAQTRFGVTLTRDELGKLPESAWENEDDFYDAVVELASNKKNGRPASEQNGDDVAGKEKTPPEDEETRITRAVRNAMGIASPASPKAAAARGKAPTAEDVRTTVSTYNSALGPKANIKALKEQRARMGN